MAVTLALDDAPAALMVSRAAEPLVATVGPLPYNFGYFKRIKGAAVLDDDSVLLLLDFGAILDRSFPLKERSLAA